jgi:hypothetical protein
MFSGVHARILPAERQAALLSDVSRLLSLSLNLLLFQLANIHHDGACMFIHASGSDHFRSTVAHLRTRAENGPTFFGLARQSSEPDPASSVFGPARCFLSNFHIRPGHGPWAARPFSALIQSHNNAIPIFQTLSNHFFTW